MKEGEAAAKRHQRRPRPPAEEFASLPGALAGATRAAVLSRCGKTPTAADCSDEPPGTQCLQDAAEWKRAFVFVHSREDAQHAAGFFMTELLVAGELHRLLQGRAGCGMSFW